MTSITGETGAGKSIAIDALGLCLGNRADASSVRPGASKTEVSARFSLGSSWPSQWPRGCSAARVLALSRLVICCLLALRLREASCIQWHSIGCDPGLAGRPSPARAMPPAGGVSGRRSVAAAPRRADFEDVARLHVHGADVVQFPGEEREAG